MLIAAVVLAVRLPSRVTRTIWLTLLVAGFANAVILNHRPHNLLQNNLVHYYLGAKYVTIPYENFYRSFNAALVRPQIGMRDLAQPNRMVRENQNERRAYYIDLMREEGMTFDPLASLTELRGRALRAGVIEREAQRILSEDLPSARMDDYCRDVRTATSSGSTREITDDAGFNGSPFYTLIRRVDPTLYRPLGPAAAWLNLVWQSVAVIVIAWLMGMALGLGVNSRLAMAALVFASWDFVSFALPGLIFAGLWIPVAIAMYAMHRRAVATAGIAIAWAGLIKVFPFILLLPVGTRLVKAGVYLAGKKKADGRPRQWFQLLAWCAVAAALLAFAATLSGRSWLGFIDKITAQFALGTTAGNNVSLSRGLSTLGIHDSLSPLPAILSVASLATLTAMFVRGNDREVIATLARRCLVLLAAVGWVAHKWLNYYSVAALLLLPLLAGRHRIGAPVAIIAAALTAILPEFSDPVLATYPALLGLKLAPYILIPAWLVFLEFQAMGLSKKAHLMGVAACVSCLLVTAGEAWRMHTVRSLGRTGKERLNRGDTEEALRSYKRLARLSPRNHNAYNGKAVAYVILGDLANAQVNFERAVRLNPKDVGVRKNYGRLLLQTGSIDKAAQELEETRRLAPFDDSVMLHLARVRLSQGRTADAKRLLTRARALNPSDGTVRKLLNEVQQHSTDPLQENN
jgi:tetratricopeptide (TPR) repeat protein